MDDVKIPVITERITIGTYKGGISRILDPTFLVFVSQLASHSMTFLVSDVSNPIYFHITPTPSLPFRGGMASSGHSRIRARGPQADC